MLACWEKSRHGKYDACSLGFHDVIILRARLALRHPITACGVRHFFSFSQKFLSLLSLFLYAMSGRVFVVALCTQEEKTNIAVPVNVNAMHA